MRAHASENDPPPTAARDAGRVDGYARTFDSRAAFAEMLDRVERLAIMPAPQVAHNPVQGGHTGRMDSHASPLGRDGVWHR